MDLRSTHTFPAPPAVVARAMVAPEFYDLLRLPNVAPPTVLEHEVAPARLWARIGFEYTGQLDPMARTILGTDRFGWEQTLLLDPQSGAGELRIIPSVHSTRMRCAGTITMTTDGNETVRSVQATLAISVPLLGGRAEKALAPGILERLDDEAAALTAFLGGALDFATPPSAP